MKAVDITRELERVVFLENRNAGTTPEEEDKAFAKLAEYRDGGVFAGGFSGQSPWERHPNGDELVHILKGETSLTIMTGDGSETLHLVEGMLTVVPQGHWHRFTAPKGVTVLTMTPQPTDHTSAEDPRGAE